MKTQVQIENWLREKIAAEIKIAPAAVSSETPFANYGLDSIVIVTFVDDLEEWLGTELDPTIFWEYPTIATLAAWLAEERFARI